MLKSSHPVQEGILIFLSKSSREFCAFFPIYLILTTQQTQIKNNVDNTKYTFIYKTTLMKRLLKAHEK